MLRSAIVLIGTVLSMSVASAQSVIVAPGDSLSKIAARVLGDGNRWVEICKSNESILGNNCDHLTVGKTLVLRPTVEDREAPSAASPVDDIPATNYGPELKVSELDPEHLARTASAETFGGVASLRLTALAEKGNKRQAFLIDLSNAKRAEIKWSLKTAEAGKTVVLLFSGARNVYGTVNLTLAGQELQASSTGAVEGLGINAIGDWSTLTFSFDVASGQTRTQMIVYPAGTSQTAIATPATLTATTPAAFAVRD